MDYKTVDKQAKSMGIRAKLIAIFVLVKVVPLLLLAWLLTIEVGTLGTEVESRVGTITKQMERVVFEVGNKASSDSVEALDTRSREMIERLTTETSANVARFLYDRDNDILLARSLPQNEAAFKSFLASRTRTVTDHQPWVLSDDEQSWQPTNVSQDDKTPDIVALIESNKDRFHYKQPFQKSMKKRPLFLEMTVVDLSGQEILKVTTSDEMNSQLLDISLSKNTYIKAENYFSDLQKLQEGDIYVSNVIGAYLPSPIIGPYTPDAAKKKGIAFEPQKSAYAGKENPVGKRFQGIIRWATPIVTDGKISAYVTLALDHTHIMEFTDHILPTDERYSDISDPGSGNYAFMWDYEGRNISHPRDYFIVGYDPKTGEPSIPWLEDKLYDEWKESGLSVREFIETAPRFREQSQSKKPAIPLLKQGQLALDCRFLNFAPQCTDWMTLTQHGGSGSFVIFWSKLWKLTTAATIPYYTGQYAHSPRGFGFVTIGANVNEFHQPALESKKRLQKIITEQTEKTSSLQQQLVQTIKNALERTYIEIGFSTIIMTLMVVILAIWLASYFTKRITHFIHGIKVFQQGDLDYRISSKSNDEMGQLASSFNHMAEEIESSFDKIQTSKESLSKQNDENQFLMKKMEQEISQRKEAEKTLNHLAYFDSLTELPNRSQLHKKLASIQNAADSKAKSSALLFIDLDGFKDINDTLGHSVGDKLLLNVANRLRNNSRNDDFIARLGGDEFTIIVRDVTSPSVVERIAQETINVLSKTFSVLEHNILISASIGISIFSDHDFDIDNIMKSADTAMYHAKEQGKSCYKFCTDELNQKIEDRMQMISDLRLALEQNEFVLHYQPKVDTDTSTLIGLEALIRWQDPNKGLIPPDDFIPVAEETGLIVQIGKWVIRDVCQQLSEWQQQGVKLVPVSLNVSARQFTESNLVEFISKVLAEFSVPPHLLEVELTETLVMQNPTHTIDVLQHLHDLGIHSSIDDFGTGYSSLAYLKQFPVNTLKIDRAFIQDMTVDDNGKNLVLAMIRMAHSMEIKVVAEGVENEEQRATLQTMSCDYIQGYLFSRPLPLSELIPWLKDENANR